MIQDTIQAETSDISVIICAYTERRWDDLAAAVSSVQQQTLPAREIIVVIDHNPQLFNKAQADLTGIAVIQNQEERGLSGARNSGVAIAQGQFIAFLDDDALADANWLMLFQQVLQDPHILGVGGSVVPLWVDHNPSWLPEEFYWVVGCTYLGMPQNNAPIRNPIGASMCLRREVFESVGGFRSGIGRVGTRPIGCEETELCIRASQHWPVRQFFYQPQARVQHRVPGQRAQWSYFWSRCYAEGISKAFITRYVGTKDALSSENTYTFHTLPRGVTRNIKSVFTQHNPGGLLKAIAIITGLGVTAGGYIIGRLFSRKNEQEQSKQILAVHDRQEGDPTPVL
ncbi:glycosyl transferase family 2 [Ktedonobacter sp. SOSP1-85]|uniref:glycosyltransferase family 2 protein n=1 Tax=Ktedonobacter sp. SOSP1-85 TaxID=2778367 RepID=UPI001914DA5B|nr:glycosyltransferase family 2 protein [Ktedonobacter sp. SOSP1-85]GHO81115.1 glycosyl transferase family 2 [Ktedonobacter sp. SOSP1-85]